MLQFILGTGGTGKTALIHNKIEELVRGGEQVLMLVPDQISFETEKSFLEHLGASRSRSVTVFGFDGMCRHVFQQTRCVPSNVIDNGTRAVLMSAALEQLSEKNVVELDDERKAAMVSNLLVVLCGNHDAQPIVNSGSLY